VTVVPETEPSGLRSIAAVRSELTIEATLPSGLRWIVIVGRPSTVMVLRRSRLRGVGNGNGPEAQLMRTMIDAFAAYERALIRARTKAALAAKAARGERTSLHAPYGWRVGGEDLTDVEQKV